MSSLSAWSVLGSASAFLAGFVLAASIAVLYPDLLASLTFVFLTLFRRAKRMAVRCFSRGLDRSDVSRRGKETDGGSRLDIHEDEDGDEDLYENLDIEVLNTVRPTTQWMNMGWWTSRPDNDVAVKRASGDMDLVRPPSNSFPGKDRPRTLPEACEALARELYTSCGLPLRGRDERHARADEARSEGIDILELGHGPGESLLLLLSEAGDDGVTSRLTSLHGVTFAKAEARHAASQVRQLKESRLQGGGNAADTDVRVWCGDALEWLRSGSGIELAADPTTTSSGHKAIKYDYIFALDCAYHFKGTSREDFFKAALSRLKPGGKLGLFDLCVSTPYPSEAAGHRSATRDTATSTGAAASGQDVATESQARLDSDHSASGSPAWFVPSHTLPPPTNNSLSLVQRIKLRIFTALVSVPAHNLIPFAEYHSHLVQAGFGQVKIRDVSGDVFPGFATFLRGFTGGEEWRGGAGGYKMKVALGGFAGFVEDWALGGDVGLLRGAIVVATAPSS